MKVQFEPMKKNLPAACYAYVYRIKNNIKRGYALAYVEWKAGVTLNEPVAPAEILGHAAQTIRVHINMLIG
jgi:hypothetical protein